MHGLWTRLRMRRLHVAALVGVVAALTLAIVAIASHPEVSLSGSNFEIDTNANLKVDDAAPSIDWASVAETRKADVASGSGDDSFGQGTKEDTAVPTVVNGSIPPQKSDLLTFGVYLESNANGDFLNLFWHRVQEPNGTTNMDFEFNKSKTLSANGVTPVRTAGDLLIQYDLSQGGTNPTLFVSRWVTTGASSQCEASNSVPCWGTKANLTAAGDATGSINTSPIPAAESDGLGDISPRTFGEAQLDFNAVSGGGCSPFGSAYLKSRSSDSFTAAMKDFIAPAALNLGRCGAVKVTKTRKHAADGTGDHPHAGVTFTLKKGTTTVATGQTDGNGEVCFGNLPFDSYTVTETVPTGYTLEGTNDRSVTVDNEAACADNPYGGETLAFHNTPRTDIAVSVDSQVNGGTSSTISCVDSANNTEATGSTGATGDGSATASNLPPDTYTCTVVVDP